MKKRKSRKRKDTENYRALAKWTTGIVLIAFGLIFALASVGLAGLAGTAIFGFGFSVVGVAAFLLPILLIGKGL